MIAQENGTLPRVIRMHESEILSEWIRDQGAGERRKDALQLAENRRVSKDFLGALVASLDQGSDVASEGWAPVRDILDDFSGGRAVHGYSPGETAAFIFSLKPSVFARLRGAVADAAELSDQLWQANVLIDKLGLYTVNAYQKSREEVIARQQRELLELSTPVVELWTGILALPLIGTLDSARTQVVMESLLDRIIELHAHTAIIDITGVPTVDTLVAQHLMKTVAAARLMGVECMISGIRPQIAQTIVHLGVDLGTVTTKASLADAFMLALKRSGATISGAKR